MTTTRQGKPNPRRAALMVLTRLDKGPVDLQAALDAAFAEGKWDPRDKRLATELVFGTARWRFAIDPVIRHFTGRRLKDLDRPVRTLLRLGVHQLRHTDRIPDRAAVSETVRLARGERQRRFVNGVLRAITRADAPALPQEPVARLCAEASLPAWMADRWIRTVGADGAAARAAQANASAPLTLRVNTVRTDRAALAAMLREHGATVVETPLSPLGLTVSGGGPVPGLPGYRDGLFYVQDEAGQLVSMLVDARPGEQVLDACAAPGGKASYLSTTVGDAGRVVALEQDKGRIRRLGDNLSRLGCGNVRVIQGDAGTVSAKALGGPFDRVLLDAPCSGLGVLNRHPEGKWWKSSDAVTACAGVQRKILTHLASMVRPGGRLVYAVCTGEPEESTRMLARFLQNNHNFSVVPATAILGDRVAPYVTPEGYLDTNGNAAGMDGFFAAHLAKKSC